MYPGFPYIQDIRVTTFMFFCIGLDKCESISIVVYIYMCGFDTHLHILYNNKSEKTHKVALTCELYLQIVIFHYRNFNCYKGRIFAFFSLNLDKIVWIFILLFFGSFQILSVPEKQRALMKIVAFSIRNTLLVKR